MLDLFFPPPVRLRAASRVHRSDGVRKERPSVAQERRWHIANRQRRLAAMKARYQARKQEYIDRAKQWRADNPQRYAEIQNGNQRRRRARQRAASTQEARV